MKSVTSVLIAALAAAGVVGTPGAVRAQSTIERFVLVAGANFGGSDRAELRYAVSDAERFATVMTDLGGVSPSNAIVLREPKLRELVEALDELRARVAAARRAAAATGGRTEVLVYVHVGVVRALAARVKAWNPDALTVVGGHHATVAPDDLVSSFIDVVVMGEGVSAFREVVSRHERKQSLLEIPGVAVADGASLVAEPEQSLTNLDALPFPDRHLVARHRHRYSCESMLGIDIYASFIVRPEFTASDFAALRDYCRELDLSFVSCAVLTPLPGTDLYAEVRDRLVTDDPAYFDFIHTLLPTTLPLETFYREHHDLYAKTIPLKKSPAFLRKYPWREIPGVLATSRRVFRQLKAVHRDYPADSRSAGSA